jgi:hypothetical protein
MVRRDHSRESAPHRVRMGSRGFPLEDLQHVITQWTNLQMPYEAAQSRLQLAQAHRASGNAAAASMENETATSTLDRLTSDTRP